MLTIVFIALGVVVGAFIGGFIREGKKRTREYEQAWRQYLNDVERKDEE